MLLRNPLTKSHVFCSYVRCKIKLILFESFPKFLESLNDFFWLSIFLYCFVFKFRMKYSKVVITSLYGKHLFENFRKILNKLSKRSKWITGAL